MGEIKIGNKVWRTMPEQVYKNAQDIETIQTTTAGYDEKIEMMSTDVSELKTKVATNETNINTNSHLITQETSNREEQDGVLLTAINTQKTNLETEITSRASADTTLQTNINAKQDTLVSGTNIKTINSTSILGSGNISTPNTNYYPTRLYATGLQISGYTGSSTCQLYVPYATSSQYGTIKLGSNTSFSDTMSVASSGTVYPVQVNSSGQMGVRVPTSSGGVNCDTYTDTIAGQLFEEVSGGSTSNYTEWTHYVATNFINDWSGALGDIKAILMTISDETNNKCITFDCYYQSGDTTMCVPFKTSNEVLLFIINQNIWYGRDMTLKISVFY